MNYLFPCGVPGGVGGRGLVLAAAGLDGLRRYIGTLIGYAPSRAQLRTALQNVPRVAYEDRSVEPSESGTTPTEMSPDGSRLRDRHAEVRPHWNRFSEFRTYWGNRLPRPSTIYGAAFAADALARIYRRFYPSEARVPANSRYNGPLRVFNFGSVYRSWDRRKRYFKRKSMMPYGRYGRRYGRRRRPTKRSWTRSFYAKTRRHSQRVRGGYLIKTFTTAKKLRCRKTMRILLCKTNT